MAYCVIKNRSCIFSTCEGCMASDQCPVDRPPGSSPGTGGRPDDIHHYAAFLVSRDRVLWSPFTDNFDNLRREFGVIHGPLKVVPVQMIPPDNDLTNPLKLWELSTDCENIPGSTLPGWWKQGEVENRVRKALKDWADQKLILGPVNKLSGKGQYYLANGAVVREVCDNAVIQTMQDVSRIEMLYGQARIREMKDHAEVRAARGCAGIDLMKDVSRVGLLQDVAIIRKMTDSSEVEEVKNQARVGRMRNTSSVDQIRGIAQMK